MDRAPLEQLLAMAEGHVTLGEGQVLRQREIVAEFEEKGLDASLALSLLASFETSLALHLADRDRLRRDLAAL